MSTDHVLVVIDHDADPDYVERTIDKITEDHPVLLSVNADHYQQIKQDKNHPARRILGREEVVVAASTREAQKGLSSVASHCVLASLPKAIERCNSAALFSIDPEIRSVVKASLPTKVWGRFPRGRKPGWNEGEKDVLSVDELVERVTAAVADEVLARIVPVIVRSQAGQDRIESLLDNVLAQLVSRKASGVSIVKERVTV